MKAIDFATAVVDLFMTDREEIQDLIDYEDWETLRDEIYERIASIEEDN